MSWLGTGKGKLRYRKEEGGTGSDRKREGRVRKVSKDEG